MPRGKPDLSARWSDRERALLYDGTEIDADGKYKPGVAYVVVNGRIVAKDTVKP